MSRQGEKRQKSFDNIKSFWESEASEWGEDPRVTIRDHYYRLLVKEEIVKVIKNKKNMIDIGCGTGYSTLFYSQYVKRIVGIDYSENMIKYANKFIENEKYLKKTVAKFPEGKINKIKKNIEFIVGDILDTKFSDENFDVAITERVLVNLPTRSLQKKAIKEVYRILDKKGFWVIAEASIQGNKKMNSIRNKFNLPKLERYWHNLYLNENLFEKMVKANGFLIKEKSNMECYQFLTRIIHPYIIYPKEPKFISSFNLEAMRISEKYKTYSNIKSHGFRAFFKEFRSQIKKDRNIDINKYDFIVDQIIKEKVNFSGAGNHIIYVLEKK